MSTLAGIDGFIASGFEPVRDAFAENFAREDELGAAFAVWQDGEIVVDLWGGIADGDAGTPWSRDTLQLIFSGTKGLVAACLLLMVERGELSLERPVAAYWPQFAASGKEEVRVRDIAAHTARLPGVETTLTIDDLKDDENMAAILAAQAPSSDPRARLCYHALTYGWLCGELVRRVDGRSIGEFFNDEFAEPLGLELWIGLPAAREHRVSRLALHPTWPAAPFLSATKIEHDPLIRSIWGNPDVFGRQHFPWNRADFHASEIPGANAIGTARSIARFYGLLETVLSPRTLELGRSTLSEGWDEAYGEPRRFGVGFMLQTKRMVFGPPKDAFGHGGAGGSLHGAWPSERIGFSYAMNLMRDDQEIDARTAAVLSALDRVLH